MVTSSSIAERILKINLSSFNSRRKSMNKYTNETFEKVLVQEFDKDISSHKTKDLQKEILNICEKNLLKSTDFEQDELKKLKNLKEIKKEEKQEIYFDYDDFDNPKNYMQESEYNDYVDSYDKLNNQIKVSKFKLFYLNSLKNQAIKDCNITKAIKISDEIAKIEQSINALNFEVESINNNVKSDKTKFYDDYKQLLELVTTSKLVHSIDSLKKQYSLKVINYFIAKKSLYLIDYYLGAVDKDKINDALNGDAIKQFFGDSLEIIKSDIKNVGTNS